MFRTINTHAGIAAAGPLSANVNGTDGDDYLLGTADDDRMKGLEGDDYLIAGGGSDAVYGGDGNDSLYGDGEFGVGVSDGDDLLNGGLGHDFMVGGGGADTLIGGGGDDTIYGGGLSSAASADSADLITAGLGDDFVVGGDGDDTLLGQGGDDGLRGGFGNDLLDGGGGKDRLSINFSALAEGVNYSAAGFQFKVEHTLDDGLGGVDTVINVETLSLIGTQYGDKITGSEFVDSFSGLAGNDTLLGGGGDDHFDGGAGNDMFTGGAGADTFRYYSVLNQGRDVIRDLEAGDVVELSGIDADLSAEGDQAFTMVDAFDGTAGQATLTYLDDKNRTILQLDQDGDGKADLTIAMIGDQREFDGFVL